MTTTYPRIEKMMAGYINMDAYELTGSHELDAQIRYYTTRVSPKALKELLVELRKFEAEHSGDLTDEFEDSFDFGAYIPDAKVFFDLVRTEVRARLAENSDSPSESLTEIVQDMLDKSTYWPLLPETIGSPKYLTKLSTVPFENNNRAFLPVLKFTAGKLDFQTRKLDKATPVSKAIHRIFTSQDIASRIVSQALPSEGSKEYQQVIILTLLQAYRDDRNSESYTQLLEQLLQVNGVDLPDNDNASARLTFHSDDHKPLI